MGEYFQVNKRKLLSTYPGFTYSAGIGFLSLVAWLTQDWRCMSAILGFSGFILLPLMYWYVFRMCTLGSVFFSMLGAASIEIKQYHL